MNKKQIVQTVDNEYAVQRTETIQKEIPETDKFNWQQHHDYYVKKYLLALSEKRELTQVEMSQYELAMMREGQGLVLPFIPPSTPVKE